MFPQHRLTAQRGYSLNKMLTTITAYKDKRDTTVVYGHYSVATGICSLGIGCHWVSYCLLLSMNPDVNNLTICLTFTTHLVDVRSQNKKDSSIVNKQNKTYWYE